MCSLRADETSLLAGLDRARRAVEAYAMGMTKPTPKKRTVSPATAPKPAKRPVPPVKPATRPAPGKKGR